MHARIAFFIAFGLIALVPAHADQALVRAMAESNVNQQYLIESVSISGVSLAHFHDSHLPASLRQRMTSLVGSPCDMNALGDLATRLRSALRLEDVRQHLSRGSSPDHVRVDFEVVKRDYAFDLSVPRFLYQSAQGWTTAVNASARAHEQSVSVCLGSNGDDLTERFTGFSVLYDDARLFSDRLSLSVGTEVWHDQWNPATRVAQMESLEDKSASGTSNGLMLYRARHGVSPTLTFAVSRELSVSAGASFQQMEMEPDPVSARPEATQVANAVTVGAAFTHSTEGQAGQHWEARYELRAATRELGSDYVYARHLVSLLWQWHGGRHSLTDHATAGVISGNAPLFERFVLGNSSTLRGWDHYAIDPLGGTRMVHNSVTYGFRPRAKTTETVEAFYDTGVVKSENPGTGSLRHSLGIGYRRGMFDVAMAFPLNGGRVTPILIAGMNY